VAFRRARQRHDYYGGPICMDATERRDESKAVVLCVGYREGEKKRKKGKKSVKSPPPRWPPF